MLKISNLKLKSNLILAPMAGITDLPFRMLCRKFGAELAFVEMINCRSISHKSRKTRHMLSTLAEDKPLGVQILGCEEKYILKALDVLRTYEFDIMDFNAACPAKKVVRRGEGAALLKEPKKLNKLLKLVVRNSKIPVTVKMRLGWDKDSINAREVALYAQDAGVSGVFIHGRTKIQEYGGNVDYELIAKVKKALSIPVIASGDVFSAKLAKKMLSETNCDALVIARGSFGNPWIFKEIKEFLKTGKVIARPARAKVIKIMLEHLDASIAFYEERNGVILFRKFFGWYTKGIRNIRPLREKSSRAKTREEMVGLIELLRGNLNKWIRNNQQ
ncbi:MAG: tRNA dihydrouridine synthase DusB [Candidatus Omnitrophica bacterium]|nr:tRNA dihydrouridine synthase DusB [Candidatus Omnitrophota bacterium]MBU1924037.1 tRNA dihydrouridine synthase DusB [Candidatus Omnitrophota bacterium]